ncbi:uncharacterized protein LOC108109011 [Drosophila eugracilis]|uniref:uncharacterized protein LOC108109011 n=1 Tax=Drosophila eugracilis TaxID=29029 RepID=UPI0007E7A887|nr:uncharacterized protein LOC108109011 [Drosophila eugracilis]XP_017072773.1 uncharacterized protein LOC108109011 [Drosophila eugracilis]
MKRKGVKTASRKIVAANFPPRRIPANVLKRTLEIANNPEDGYWLNKNTSCVRSISYELYVETKPSIISEKLRLARNCLMTRDYKNLAKILASNHYGEKSLQRAAFKVFTEYASFLKNYSKERTEESKSEEKPDSPKSPTIEETIDDFLS